MMNDTSHFDAASELLIEWLARLRLGEPLRSGALALVPVFGGRSLRASPSPRRRSRTNQQCGRKSRCDTDASVRARRRPRYATRSLAWVGV